MAHDHDESSGYPVYQALWDITVPPFTGSYATGSDTAVGSRTVNIEPRP